MFITEQLTLCSLQSNKHYVHYRVHNIMFTAEYKHNVYYREMDIMRQSNKHYVYYRVINIMLITE